MAGKLKNKLREIIPKHSERVKRVLKEKGDKILAQVTVAQAYGGMRDVKNMVYETSYLDPNEGIRYRGLTIPEMKEKLPRAPGGQEPLPEGCWWLLLTGEVPTEAEVKDIQEEFMAASEVPNYVKDTLRAMPKDTHPMTMFSAGILAMQRESLFVKRYNEGMKKTEYWEPMYDDCVTLLGRLPGIAAYIYRMKYRDDKHIPSNPKLDWGGNFAHMIGIDAPEYKDLVRLYFVLHADHEGGNVSAHTCHLVGSALSDIYYSVSAAMNGLAGPLHGLANQECLKWILDLMEHFGGKPPTAEEVKKYAWDTLNAGQVIPGYGHAVLRKTDPRFVAQHEFGKKYCPDDPVFQTVKTVYEVVPNVLIEQGKAKDPWPNVDAHSGCLQYHYGVKEFDFYTVMFGVGRALGITAGSIWARALAFPIERPKSVTTDWIEKNIQ